MDKEEDDGGGELALALMNVGGVFLVLGVGIALSYVLALVEFLWNVRNVSVEEHVSFLLFFSDIIYQVFESRVISPKSVKIEK